MARHPQLSAAAEVLPTSIFTRLMERLARFEGDVIPLQIGDTHLPPPEASRLGALGFSAEHDPELYAYSKPRGDDALIEAVVEKVRRDNGMGFVRAENVQITAGATHALSCSMRAVLDPGDHLLVMAPYWPLIRGIAQSCGVVPVEVPVSQTLLADPDTDVEALLEPYVTPATRGIYLCSPNNPDGKVFTHAELRDIAKVVLRHGLWVLSDEVYERFVYDGMSHQSMATIPGMAEHTLTAFSFSKSYAQAGLRVGYVVGPSDAIDAVRKLANATVYSISRAMQRAALAALRTGEPFLVQARERYQKARDIALEGLGMPTAVPQGSTYLFLDLTPWLGGSNSSLSLLERMADAGLLLAPGQAFGRDYGRWARLCFTAVEEDRLREGLERLRRVLSGTGACP